MTTTYIALAQTTLSSATSTVTFSSIPATYRDLILVMNVDVTAEGQDIRLRVNSDSSSSYSFVEAWGTGSITGSTAGTRTYFNIGYYLGTGRANIITSLMDYSATDKHKAFLTRHDKPNQGPIMIAGRWPNTAAINSISVSPLFNSWTVGSTFSLYGVN